MNEAVPTALISPKGAARARAGHLWIYRSDVTQRPTTTSGAVVRVADPRGRAFGWAHFGAESEITLRLLTTADVKPDRAFWRARLQTAAHWRTRIVTNSDAYRLVHAEGDGLPGLIIDRYGDCFSLQTLTRGMDVLKPLWVELLIELFQPRLIVERNDAKVRQLEGLPLINSVLYAAEGADPVTPPEFTITENGLKFWIDLLGGQKTGAFLDQRENRAAARNYGQGRALDCFSFHGSFALHLAQTCAHVTALDISEPAIERAQRNATLNGLTNLEFRAANVFDQLRDYALPTFCLLKPAKRAAA
jgi:23S rRNA (cytosine1962-C5)-methyltransferase